MSVTRSVKQSHFALQDTPNYPAASSSCPPKASKPYPPRMYSTASHPITTRRLYHLGPFPTACSAKHPSEHNPQRRKVRRMDSATSRFSPFPTARLEHTSQFRRQMLPLRQELELLPHPISALVLRRFVESQQSLFLYHRVLIPRILYNLR